MTLFFDSCTLLAACGSSRGAARLIFSLRERNGWDLVVSPYVLTEVDRHLPELSADGIHAWMALRPQLRLVDDEFAMNRIVVFPNRKDRPVLFAALASAHVLLTLDQGEFREFLGGRFYGLRIMTPREFLDDCDARNSIANL